MNALHASLSTLLKTTKKTIKKIQPCNQRDSSTFSKHPLHYIQSLSVSANNVTAQNRLRRK